MLLFGYAVEHQEQSTLGEDIHGAGGLRFDTKILKNGPSPSDDERIYNFVRLVRDAEASSGIGDNESSLPQEFELGQNYPNPFTQSTTISFTLSAASKVSLQIYNINNHQIATLVNKQLSAGNHQFQWNTQDMPSGIIFNRLSSSSFSQTKRMVLLK